MFHDNEAGPDTGAHTRVRGDGTARAQGQEGQTRLHAPRPRDVADPRPAPQPRLDKVGHHQTDSRGHASHRAKPSADVIRGISKLTELLCRDSVGPRYIESARDARPSQRTCRRYSTRPRSTTSNRWTTSMPWRRRRHSRQVAATPRFPPRTIRPKDRPHTPPRRRGHLRAQVADDNDEARLLQVRCGLRRRPDGHGGNRRSGVPWEASAAPRGVVPGAARPHARREVTQKT